MIQQRMTPPFGRSVDHHWGRPVNAVSGFLERGLTYFREQNIDPETIVEARLAPDMLPLRFQIISVAQHSRGAIEAVQSGEFRPPASRTLYDYAGLQGLVAQTREALEGWTPEAVNALDAPFLRRRFSVFT